MFSFSRHLRYTGIALPLSQLWMNRHNKHGLGLSYSKARNHTCVFSLKALWPNLMQGDLILLNNQIPLFYCPTSFGWGYQNRVRWDLIPACTHQFLFGTVLTNYWAEVSKVCSTNLKNGNEMAEIHDVCLHVFLLNFLKWGHLHIVNRNKDSLTKLGMQNENWGGGFQGKTRCTANGTVQTALGNLC